MVDVLVKIALYLPPIQQFSLQYKRALRVTLNRVPRIAPRAPRTTLDGQGVPGFKVDREDR